MSDEDELKLLNEQYLKAYMTADVAWYREHLAEEFTCKKADGTVLDKAEFLRQTAAGPDVAEYRLERVRIRSVGETAAVDGTGTFIRPDGVQGTSRYTDVYMRMGRDWRVISAEFSRTLHPAPASTVKAST